jgi:deferrochelatase/peroxidase EfeB
MKNGSFQLFRRLAQDAAGGKRQDGTPPPNPDDPSRFLRAKLIGRWPDGDRRSSPESARPRFRLDENAFTTRAILSRRRHATRTSAMYRVTRSLGDNRRRIIRRGIPFGDELPDGEEDRDTEEEARAALQRVQANIEASLVLRNLGEQPASWRLEIDRNNQGGVDR